MPPLQLCNLSLPLIDRRNSSIGHGPLQPGQWHSTHRSNGQDQSDYVQHPVAHCRFVEGMSQGLIIAEETALVWFTPDEEEQDWETDCNYRGKESGGEGFSGGVNVTIWGQL